MNKIIFTFLLSVFAVCAYSQMVISRLRCEYRDNPIGIANKNPILSWQLSSNERNVSQSAYRVLVADDPEVLNRGIGNVWDSKQVKSAASVNIEYSGKQLRSSKTYYWKIMVWDNHHQRSAWSETCRWQMGLFTPGDWRGAKWIGYEKFPDSLKIVPAIDNSGDKRWTEGQDILPIMRKEFSVQKG